MRKRCFLAGRSTMRRSFSDLLLDAEVVHQVDVGAEDAEGLAVDDGVRRRAPEVERHLDVVVLARRPSAAGGWNCACGGAGREAEAEQARRTRRRTTEACAWIRTLGWQSTAREGPAAGRHSQAPVCELSAGSAGPGWLGYGAGSASAGGPRTRIGHGADGRGTAVGTRRLADLAFRGHRRAAVRQQARPFRHGRHQDDDGQHHQQAGADREDVALRCSPTTRRSSLWASSCRGCSGSRRRTC